MRTLRALSSAGALDDCIPHARTGGAAHEPPPPRGKENEPRGHNANHNCDGASAGANGGAGGANGGGAPIERLVTTDPRGSLLHVVPLAKVSFKGMREYAAALQGSDGGGAGARFDEIVGFRPTGWSFDGGRGGASTSGATTTTTATTAAPSHRATSAGNIQPSLPSSAAAAAASSSLLSVRKSGALTIYGVPYSEHSSFAELADCVRCLQPMWIVPTVDVAHSQEQVARLLHHNNNTPHACEA